MQILAEHAFIRGEKSVELVQALQITSLWYRAFGNYSHMNLTQLIQTAVSMAVDLGLYKAHRLKSDCSTSEVQLDAEAKRAWLGCFLLSSSLSLIKRSPGIATWTSTIDRLIGNLRLAQACPSDTFFCDLVELERNYRDVDLRLHLSDYVESVSLRDPQTVQFIGEYASMFEARCADRPSLNQNLILKFGKFTGLLYVHEIALHIDNNVAEFEAPFSATSLQSFQIMSKAEGQVQHEMLGRVSGALQGLLDTFLCFPVLDMASLCPHIYGGRVIYAVILLIKLHKAAGTAPEDFGNELKLDRARLQSYLGSLEAISEALLARDERSTLGRSLLMMKQLKDWLAIDQAQWKRDPLSQRLHRDENDETTSTIPTADHSNRRQSERVNADWFWEDFLDFDLPDLIL
ncbi:fungal specific transcription factor domain-containing protein [Purpureocillium lilacinum]|uniref:Fungal specific transcription factor domain-containing protein n=1 Tax=Purpureocillium lilacinum TaxID=33203 RepID=A0A179FEN0_PURLI|nr:fungal specific transcription factor domain-containing protein [Purpureocillium lilacinum]